ncbi:MAG: hypothetical protein OXI32_03260 [bacterium]|nr:hypothetical protein [bacterium]
MSEFALTNRELALVVALLFWSAFVGLSSRRDGSGGGLAGSVRGLLSEAAYKEILGPVAAYLCWLAAALAAADAVGLWDRRLATAAAFWLLFSGLGLFGAGIDAAKTEGAITGAFKRLVGAAVVFEFVANLASFSLFVEIPAQILAVPCGAVAAWGSARREHRRAGRLASGYLSFLGLAALGWGVARLVLDWKAADKGLLWRELVMPLWLAPAALTFMALLALYLVYDTVFTVMASDSAVGLSWRHRLAVLSRCGLRLRAARAMPPAADWLANDPGFRSTRKWAGRVVRKDRDRRVVEAAKEQRLVDNAGAVGADSDGRQLDRREHAETVKALEWLYTCQLGHYRRGGGRYSAAVEAIIDRLSEQYGLPSPNNVELRVSGDGQRWYAARQTVTGHWFAIGAAGPPPDQWFYDGPIAPAGFPDESEWDHWAPDSNSPNWDETPEARLGGTGAPETGNPGGSDACGRRRLRAGFRNLLSRAMPGESDRPTWCCHFDEWKRAFEEAEALKARNSDRTEDWSREDLVRLEELTSAFAQAAGRMWDEAPESENWASAHIKCG